MHTPRICRGRYTCVQQEILGILQRLPTSKIHSVTRITLDRVLKKQFKRLKKGKVLDVGSSISPYKHLIPYTKYVRLDIDPHSKPDLVCDLHKIKWKSEDFDTIIATEVMEHLREPHVAIKEIYRVLKKGGRAILSTRFIYPVHAVPYDYFRYTESSLRHLFKDFKKVEIIPHGNRLQAAWQLLNFNRFGFIFNIFNPIFALFNFKDEKIPLGFVIYAEK